MHLANQSSGKLDKLSKRVHLSRQAIPEFNGGNALDKREATDSRDNNKRKKCLNPEKQDRGEC